MNSFDSVIAFSKRAQHFHPLDIGLQNAGVKTQEWEQIKLTRHETTVQINHYNTALLCYSLCLHSKPRQGERSAPRILDELDDEKKWDNPDRYHVSKPLDVLWTRELASKVNLSEIVINTANPGLMKSNLHRENTNGMENRIPRMHNGGGRKDEC